MAATRLIALHINKGKTIAHTLADRTDYSKNEEKTEGGRYISSYECDARTADEEFLLSKRQYEHMTGRRQEHDVIAYQIRQSFKPGEITPGEANQIGYELGMRFTKGKHAFIVATHIDRAHIHNHIIFNSATLDCTRKFRDFFLSGLALQRVSDRLCLEHGLSVIEPRPYRERKKRTEYPKRTSNRDDLRAIIDTALQRKPKDFEELISFLKEAGCEYKQGKRPSIRCKGKDRFARFSSLSKGYTVDDLKEAIVGKQKVWTAGKSQQVHDKKFSLLIDIQAKLNEGKGTGYQRWATLFNLKQMAQVMCFLQENGIDSFARSVYIPSRNVYICPMGKFLYPSCYVTKKHIAKYGNPSACSHCPKKCTTMRYFYVERMIKKSEFSKECDISPVPLKKIRILQNKAISSQRKCIVEHPSGAVKHDMGVRQLLLRGIRKAEGELSLVFLAFNMKRALNVVGIKNLMAVLG